VYPHITAPSWHAALDALSRAAELPDTDGDWDATPPPERVPVVLVKGAKRSGKSALARAALNRLLGAYEQVAWLECDLGQGEFGCNGVVGLWVLERPVLGELKLTFAD
jgi:polynucleotide 5'-hydroxyl-kinase GRC3/NOL9